MKYRKLGASDLSVSEISLGSVSGVANKNAAACVERAFDLGRNFSDTANAYGRGATASFLGNVLSKRSRDSYILATKVHFPVSARDKGLLVHNQVNAACNHQQPIRQRLLQKYDCCQRR